MPRFSKENLEHNIKLAEAIEPLAKARGITPAQFSLAWVLYQGNGILRLVTVANEFDFFEDIFPIPGTKSPQKALENFAAANISLTQEELDKVEAIIAENEVKGDRYPAEFMKLVQPQ